MSSVGSQAGGFTPPSIPLRPEETRPAIQQLTTPTTPVEKESFDAPVDSKQVLEQQADKISTQDNVKRDKAKEADSFHSAEDINSTQQEQQASKFAGQILDRKQLELLTKQYTEKINQALIADGIAPEAALDKEVAQNQNLASLASQTQLDSLDPDAKARNKKTEEKLENIIKDGGDKGKNFAAFVRRQMSQGELAESMLQLVDEYLASLKSSSLSAPDMLEAGQEPIVTLRGMMAADNTEDHQRFNDNLANSTAGSAGERLDLMAVRNLNTDVRITPPQPLRMNSTPDSQTTAARYINSISQATLPAPWDNLMLV